MLIGAAVSWGIGNLLAKKMGKMNVISLIAWSSFIAWPPLFFIALTVDGPHQFIYGFTHLSFLGIIAITYIVYPTTLFGFAMWSWLLHRYPVSVIAPFTLLVPIFALLSSMLLLHESMQWWKFVASALVITGLIINLFGSKLSLKSTKVKKVVLINE